MKQEIKRLVADAKKKGNAVISLEALEQLETEFLGRKEGAITLLMKQLKDLSPEDKKEMGPLANEAKQAVQHLFEEKRTELERAALDEKLLAEKIDVTMPGKRPVIGHVHPNSLIQKELEEIFSSLGFIIVDGPELESDFFNFEALNIPADHPAREMQDTFYVNPESVGYDIGDEKLVLRTHTSNAQVRALLKYGVPLRAVVPGRVFRQEATDASHDTTFYQMEGLMVGEGISVVNVVAVMKTLLRGIFKRDVEVRLRPGFFPFVEPGFELDINCLICEGKGCSVCKQTGWLELLPCGMIHPNVLKAGGVDPEKYSGFAFGLGLTRLVMMRYGIEDIRLINGGDLNFLKQF